MLLMGKLTISMAMASSSQTVSHYQRVIHVFLISLHQSPQSAWLAPTRCFFSWELGIHVDLIPRNQARQWKSPSWNSNHGFLVTGSGQGSIIILFFCAPPPPKTHEERERSDMVFKSSLQFSLKPRIYIYNINRCIIAYIASIYTRL